MLQHCEKRLEIGYVPDRQVDSLIILNDYWNTDYTEKTYR